MAILNLQDFFIYLYTFSFIYEGLQQTSTVAKVRVIIICYTGNPGVVDACDRSLSLPKCAYSCQLMEAMDKLIVSVAG